MVSIASVRQTAVRVAQYDRVELTAQLTLALLLLHAPKQWYVQGPVVVLCIAGLTFGWLRREWRLWFLLFAFLASSVYYDWATADNHKYLECYWVVAFACAAACAPENRRRVLGFNGRLLIALCMLFATGWKLASPSYRSGDFFEFILLTDDRFEDLAAWVGDVPIAVAQQNHIAEKVLTTGYLRGIDVDQVQLHSSEALRRLAQIMTWWTVLIEGALAVLFLPVGSRRWKITRDIVLILFAATTYLVATVKGFGWLLVIMGLAQCEEKEAVLVPLYLITFFAIQLYTMPYAEAAPALFRMVL